jgi:hypothetical protein
VSTAGDRIVEVRMILIVLVDITDPEFIETLAQAKSPSSVHHVVASEVVSNLESVAYVDSVIASSL